MRILIVSDTHAKLDNFKEAVKRSGPFELLIHCGDVEGDEERIRSIAGCPCMMVRGNNDFFSDLPGELTLNADKYKIFVTHGHRYNVSIGPEMIAEEARDREVDIVMFGHTHKPLVEKSRDLVVLNPGSISYPRQDGRRPSYVIMETDRKGEAHFTINYL